MRWDVQKAGTFGPRLHQTFFVLMAFLTLMMLSTIHISHHLSQKVEDFDNELGISSDRVLLDRSDFDIDPWAKDYRGKQPSKAQAQVVFIVNI